MINDAEAKQIVEAFTDLLWEYVTIPAVNGTLSVHQLGIIMPAIHEARDAAAALKLEMEKQNAK